MSQGEVSLIFAALCASVTGVSLPNTQDDGFVANTTYSDPGKIEVRWEFKSLLQNESKEDFTLSYGIIDREKNSSKWMQLRHVPCCGATLNKLRGHAHYGVKLTAVVDNHTVSSAVQEVYVTQGVPYQPRDIAITVDAGGNQTLLTWKQDYANYVLYYNVALRMRDKVHQANTVQPRCRFDFAPDVNTSLEINVSAVNAYGSSELQVMFHVSSGDKNVTVSSPAPGIAPVVIVVPVIILGLLVLSVSLFYWQRRRTHSNRRRMSVADNGLPNLPLHLRNIWLEETRSLTRESFYDVESVIMDDDKQSTDLDGGQRFGYRSYPYCRLEEYDLNRTSQGTTPPPVPRQLVDSSPYLAPRRTRPPSSISRATNPDRRSGKQTPIIPLPREKLLARVGVDPANNLSQLSGGSGS